MDKEHGYLHTMEYYSAIKENEIVSFARKCTELESIMLNKISKIQREKYNKFSHIYGI
jgi:hypothetical protein